MLPSEQVQGLIPTIQSITLENLKLQAEIAQKEEEMKNSALYQDIQTLKNLLKQNETLDTELREKGKQIMLQNNLKDLEMLDGTTISLHKTPGSLKIASDENIPEEFWRVKREVDKIALKKAFLAGECLDPNITIESSYTFVIKQK